MEPAAHPRPLGLKAECLETLRLAGPLALANLLQMLAYAVDVIFIARLGAHELDASALAVALFGLLVWALQGLVGSVAPVIAAELGARAPALRPVRRAVRMALWLAVIAGGLAMVLCTQAGIVMRLTGQDPRVGHMAAEFMQVLLFAIVPMVMAGTLRSFVSALGRPFYATAITAAGIGINALGNYLLVFGNLGAPALGLAGSAVSTVITAVAIVGLYILAIRLDPQLHRYRVFALFWRFDGHRLKQLLAIGLPIATTILAEAGVFGAAAFLMGRIGADQLAAHTLALQICSFAFMVPFGVSQAATIRVGLFYGAREPQGVRQAGLAALIMGVGFMGLTASAMLFAPHLLLSLYLDPADPANAALVGHATAFLLVGAAFQLFDGTQVVATGALRGLQDTRVPMWIALFSYWIPGFGLAVGLGFFTPLEGLGVWIGLAAGLVFASALLLTRWHRRDRLGLVPA